MIPNTSVRRSDLFTSRRNTLFTSSEYAHHCRHRSSVRRLTPTTSRSWATLPGVSPCRSAVTSTTTTLTYTRRDRNRNDGGVVLFRHPSRAQQKLCRRE